MQVYTNDDEYSRSIAENRREKEVGRCFRTLALHTAFLCEFGLLLGGGLSVLSRGLRRVASHFKPRLVARPVMEFVDMPR